MPSLITELQRRANCVYLAAEEAIADDLSKVMLAAVSRIKKLEAAMAEFVVKKREGCRLL